MTCALIALLSGCLDTPEAIDGQEVPDAPLEPIVTFISHEEIDALAIGVILQTNMEAKCNITVGFHGKTSGSQWRLSNYNGERSYINGTLVGAGDGAVLDGMPIVSAGGVSPLSPMLNPLSGWSSSMSGRLNISANAAVTYLFTGFGLAPSQGAPAAHFELSCQDAVDVWVGATTEHLVALTPSNAGSGAAVSWTAMLGPEPEHTMATGGDQRIRLGGERAVAMAIFNPWEKSVEGSFSLEGTSGNTTIRMQPGVTERLTHMGPPGEHTVTFDIERTSSVPFWGVLAGVDEVTDEGLYRMTGTPLPTRH